MKNKKLLIAAVAAFVVILAVVLIIALGSNEPAAPTNPTSTPAAGTSQPTAPATTAPTVPTTLPATTAAPTQPTTAAPTQPTAAPTQPTTAAPTQPTTAPAAPTQPPHVHNYTAAVTSPTCITGGYTTYTCACGDSYSANEVAALGHSFTNYVSNNDATCILDGTMTACCDRCGEPSTVVDEDSVLGHAYAETVTAPTCTEGGYTTYLCECGDSYVSDHTSAAGHAWGEWVTTLQPTEETEGQRERTCANCGTTETGSVAKLPESHKHNYQSQITQPTCLQAGYTTYVCECGDTYAADEVAALGHSFTNYVSNNDATCTVDGTQTAKCDRCQQTNTVADPSSALGHSYVKAVTAPTCTEGGYTLNVCACGQDYRSDETPATGHSWGEWVTVTEPTEETEGQRERTCGTCTAKESGVIAKLPPHEHSYVGIVTEPTCATDGYTLYICACGDNYAGNIVGAYGHYYEIAVTQPTCTTGGYTTYTCACGDTYTADESAMLDHNWGGWTITKEPTAEEEGTRVRQCQNCTATQEETFSRELLTYEEYTALSAEEQESYYYSFASVQDFLDWYNSAYAEWEEEQNRVEIGDDGNIDIGDLVGGEN